MSVVETLKNVFAKRAETAAQQYVELVCSECDGKTVSHATAEQVLRAAGKTLDDLERDVQARRDRIAKIGELRRLLAEESERPTIVAQLAAADAAVIAAQEKHAGIVGPLRDRLMELDAHKFTITSLQNQLAPPADATTLEQRIGAMHERKCYCELMAQRALSMSDAAPLKAEAARLERELAVLEQQRAQAAIDQALMIDP